MIKFDFLVAASSVVWSSNGLKLPENGDFAAWLYSLHIWTKANTLHDEELSLKNRHYCLRTAFLFKKLLAPMQFENGLFHRTRSALRHVRIKSHSLNWEAPQGWDVLDPNLIKSIPSGDQNERDCGALCITCVLQCLAMSFLLDHKPQSERRKRRKDQNLFSK